MVPVNYGVHAAGDGQDLRVEEVGRAEEDLRRFGDRSDEHVVVGRWLVLFNRLVRGGVVSGVVIVVVLVVGLGLVLFFQRLEASSGRRAGLGHERASRRCGRLRWSGGRRFRRGGGAAVSEGGAVGERGEQRGAGLVEEVLDGHLAFRGPKRVGERLVAGGHVRRGAGRGHERAAARGVLRSA